MQGIFINPPYIVHEEHDKRINKDKVRRIHLALKYNEHNVTSFTAALNKFGLQTGQLAPFKSLRFYYNVGMTRSKIRYEIKRHEANWRKQERIRLEKERVAARNILHKKERMALIASVIECYISTGETLSFIGKKFRLNDVVVMNYINRYFEKPDHDSTLQSSIND